MYLFASQVHEECEDSRRLKSFIVVYEKDSNYIWKVKIVDCLKEEGTQGKEWHTCTEQSVMKSNEKSESLLTGKKEMGPSQYSQWINYTEEIRKTKVNSSYN